MTISLNKIENKIEPEIAKQIAFDNNNLASIRKKWATFKQCSSEYNLTNTVN